MIRKLFSKSLKLMTYVNWIDPSDPSIKFAGKGRKPSDVRWSTCPLGKAFIVERSLEEVRNNKKRPSVPAAFTGQYTTKAITDPVPGYLVTHIKGV